MTYNTSATMLVVT